ncbi:MAG: GTP-binding protein [Candidatus Heimdallarchaeota archaeon]|nr:MAG: GTP-binding protein [Candidatus Heimdallarchaeota archaeon]
MTVYKIALIGDGGVGKTSIRERYLGNGFKAEYLLTVGADFAMRDDTINGFPARYQIWDLAGQQRFDGVREAYYTGCLGALLVYDITRPDSFFNLPKWINELWINNGRGRVPIVVVANKTDLYDLADNTISPSQGREFTQNLSNLTESNGFQCHFIETSAKTGRNIPQAFSLLGTHIPRFIDNHRRIPVLTSCT